MRAPLILLIFLVANVLGTARLYAEDLRVLESEAIISTPYTGRYLRTESFALSKLNRSSFGSLGSKKLSSLAREVHVSRKHKNRSVRYLKSRNPCNSPAITRLLRVSKNLRCEPNWEVKASLAPNDTQFVQGNMYAMSTTGSARINAQSAWDITTGSSSVVIGIIDTGIQYTHPDLVSNIWINPNEIASNSIDDDGNGYVDDIYGIDRYNNDSDPMDDHYHGTHVAGTIGGVGNNGAGVVGVAWNVKMIGCKFLGSNGSGSTAGAIGCVNYFTDLKNNHGINVVATNNSWGGGGFSSTLRDAIAASRDADIVFVAAAGNSAVNIDTSPQYPAAYTTENIISVAAVDSNGNLANFSNYGTISVDIAAPGVSILSTYTGSQYAYLSGTSMACPHVAGAVALIKSYNPSLSYSEVISNILNSGTSLGSLSGVILTGKTLNANDALIASAPTPTPTPTSTPTETATPSGTLTNTPTPTASATPTATNVPTETPTVTPTASATPTNTATPVPTSTPTLTNTPEIAPTNTPTPEATATPVPPTSTTIPDPVLSNIRLQMSIRRSRSSLDISCKLTGRENGGAIKPLAGYPVSLMNSDRKRRARDDTNSQGIVYFRMKVQRTYYCEFKSTRTKQTLIKFSKIRR